MAGERGEGWANMGCVGKCWGVKNVDVPEIGTYCNHTTCVDSNGKRKRWHLACCCEHFRAGVSDLQGGRWSCPSCRGAFETGAKQALHHAQKDGLLTDQVLAKNKDKKECEFCHKGVNYKNWGTKHTPYCKGAIAAGAAPMYTCTTCGYQHREKMKVVGVSKAKHKCEEVVAKREAEAKKAAEKAEKAAQATADAAVVVSL